MMGVYYLPSKSFGCCDLCRTRDHLVLLTWPTLAAKVPRRRSQWLHQELGAAFQYQNAEVVSMVKILICGDINIHARVNETCFDLH